MRKQRLLVIIKLRKLVESSKSCLKISMIISSGSASKVIVDVVVVNVVVADVVVADVAASDVAAPVLVSVAILNSCFGYGFLLPLYSNVPVIRM